MPPLEGGRDLGKTKVRALKKAYEAINKQFKLTNKSEFRDKMGLRTILRMCVTRKVGWGLVVFEPSCRSWKMTDRSEEGEVFAYV